MNSSVLAKHYDKLTPWERVPMIWAAEARGDHTEAKRLARSAPRGGFQVADCYGLDLGLLWLAAVQHMEQLDLAAFYVKTAMFLEANVEYANQELHGRIQNMRRVLACRIVLNADAWKLICADLNIDASWLFSNLPGNDTVKATEREAREIAFSKGEAEAYLSKNAPAEFKADARVGMPTAEEMVAEMRKFLEHCLREWQ